MAKKTRQEKTEVENISHGESKRANIPTSEMKPLVDARQKKPVLVEYEKRKPALDPQLIWRGKYEGDDSLTVKAPPLYIQEKIHPKALIEELRRTSKNSGKAGVEEEAAAYQLNLFSDFNGIAKEADKTDFYQHEQNWTNRMILGDSLQVMASLAEREGLRGKVQAIYMDPPYGIKFNSNFQWSTNSRESSDTKLDNITREPEQVKAFRDTWEDGIHSYLSYLRDRLILARDLLTESGSIFVQIGDENVHRVRMVMDEVFGDKNIISEIPFLTTTGSTDSFLGNAINYILWYGKDKKLTKFNKLFAEKIPGGPGGSGYTRYKGEFEAENLNKISNLQNKTIKGVYAADNLTSQSIGRSKGEGAASWFAVNWHGHEYKPSLTVRWKTNEIGMERLLKADRIVGNLKTLNYIRYLSDFPVYNISNYWDDTVSSFMTDKIYVVQTNTKVIQRCLLMATDPGDLVLDPTCGSGTTAYVAEQWGRRWITIDTSRVALALARARLMGARFPFYILADSWEGAVKEEKLYGILASRPYGKNISFGFVYERVPHITLKSIANNEEIDAIWAKWQPGIEDLRGRLNKEIGRNFEEWEMPQEAESAWSEKARTIHAQFQAKRRERQREIDASIQARAEYEYLYDKPYEDRKKVRVSGPFTVESISPYRVLSMEEEGLPLGETRPELEHRDFTAMILENLRSAGVRQAKKDDRISFYSLEMFPSGQLICAEGRYREGEEEKRAAIFIGPEFGTVSREDIIEAAREAGAENFDILIVCAFNFEANTEDLRKRGYMPILKARMNAELHMSEALRKTDRGNLFVVFGEPDIEVLPELDEDGKETGRLYAEIKGVDVYRPATGEIVSDNAKDIACWLLDTNYNEESFFVRHAYFLGQKNPYESLKKALNAEIDRGSWEALNSTKSRPFARPESGRIAVKVINHLGDEVMKVFKV